MKILPKAVWTTRHRVRLKPRIHFMLHSASAMGCGDANTYGVRREL